jgi:DNA repair protein RadC
LLSLVATPSFSPRSSWNDSDHDRELTQALKAAGATVGVRFLDHPIIGEATPFSFKANGLL